jgi:hypothetical protein
MKKVTVSPSLFSTIDMHQAAQNTRWLEQVSQNVRSAPWAWMQEQVEVCGIYAKRAANYRYRAYLI